MFKKSVTFFILVALFWVLLWVYIPDATPENFTISDVFRGFLLLFSLMAFSFSLLMLVIRYKGVDLITNLFPQANIAMWIAKNAYQYSQPKTIVSCRADENLNGMKGTIETAGKIIPFELNSQLTQTIDLGHLKNNPTFKWQNSTGQKITEKLVIKPYLKKLGKNLHLEVIVSNNKLKYKIN